MLDIKKKIAILFIFLFISVTLCNCGKSEEEKLQNKLWDILSDEAVIDVISNEDGTYKVTINYGYGTLPENFHDTIDLCKENNVTTIYAWFKCKQGELKYKYEKNEESYKVTIGENTYNITEEDADRVLGGSSPYLISKEALNLLYKNEFGESYSYSTNGNLTITTNEDGWPRCTYDLAQEILMADDNIETVTYYQEYSQTLITWKRLDETESSEKAENCVGDSEYYINDQGILVDKVEEFEIQTINGDTIKYPILGRDEDEVVVYEFDTYNNQHIVIDASNVYQQTALDEMGDYGDIELEIVAPGKDVVYMFDGENYYIEDYSMNLITISKPMQ